MASPLRIRCTRSNVRISETNCECPRLTPVARGNLPQKSLVQRRCMCVDVRGCPSSRQRFVVRAVFRRFGTAGAGGERSGTAKAGKTLCDAPGKNGIERECVIVALSARLKLSGIAGAAACQMMTKAPPNRCSSTALQNAVARSGIRFAQRSTRLLRDNKAC